jgi:hypothetical protein
MRSLDGGVLVRGCANDVFDELLAAGDSRMRNDDLAYATFETYRKISGAAWRAR